MRVNRLTASGDWTFGHGKASYLVRSAAIRQNVVSRIRSFKNDWFADINHGSPWFTILGSRNNEAALLREVERIVLATTGVKKITRLRVASIDGDRAAQIELNFVDMFDQGNQSVVTII